ncbi:16S rRNA (cytidine(1402)-2'-O)-methyltransferase [Lacticaseibacillus manihotivorans]|jgi:16S rRNA (cytidine1402-2'-O)-methyltransferase|uniref:Ribosomal RNA small subunit methyltransferase I n=2 Tax=Lacticaseibacillus manihotivorans TaxID=88233 RepID=A0A0R1Q4R6_9LACO|nr:16S rRNA (cytidine(1402)-2'-O)-methyltransferase [Lacticaseibacillus manihotivorans]KRL39583.1 methyltransferase [Lacticaseibacillus manihotivorans DSM 13343 = JCM 12514]QFQ90450.1 16S rRNA (cytidine(1402)-2'-O)-methyltransferase [Lacticaseibacillus manihotivorans]
MQNQHSFDQHDSGTLFLVPTPIGNLDDMTVRAVKTLQTVDLIAAEDTRNTQKLLNHFEIETKQISFHEHNTQQRIPELIAKLQSGLSIAQVSDAGMPSISDPGKELVAAAIAANLPVVPLPGANAATTALIASGLAPQPFMFYGFLPRKASVQKAELTKLAQQEQTVIFYESPYRVAKTLTAIQAIFGDRQAVLARELTKLHEEFIRGSLSELIDWAFESARGEFVIMVQGADPVAPVASDVPLVDQVQALIDNGDKPNAAIKAVAKTNGLNRQAVYNAYHGLEETE